MRRTMLIFAAVILLGACTQANQVATAPISASPMSGIAADVAALPAPLSPTGATIGTDLQSLEYNLDQAIKVGALPAGDPLDGCVHQALTQLGLEQGQTSAPSFTPKNDGPASLGGIAYIRLKQLQAAGQVALPPACLQLIGQALVDGLKNGAAAAQAAAPILGLPPL